VNKSNILILNFYQEDFLANTLRNVLETSPSLSIQTQQFNADEVNLPLSTDTFLDNPGALYPDLIFLIVPVSLLNQAGLLLQNSKNSLSELPIIVVSEWTEPNEVLGLLKYGINDFISPPLKAIDIFPRVCRELDKTSKKMARAQSLKEKIGLSELIGESKAFMNEVSKIPAVARCDSSVLILGETGTGKEVCARVIHYLSPRAKNPFIPVNCAAIPLELVENELFGHERGAFTGASISRFGLIHEANGGTLFLDEVDCLPLLAQVKLLRFLQEKEYRPLGSTKKCEADVRVIAATNVKVEDAVRAGQFRQDLYYRLNVIPITLPPLRERKEDIMLLAYHFLAKYANKFNKQARDFSPDALQKLMGHNWPGNVRELEHIVERALVFSDQAVIQSSDILIPNCVSEAALESFSEAKSRMIEQFERSYLQGLLVAYHGNISRAAQAAKKNRRAFWQLVRKYNINVESFRAHHKEA
jgi:two-component system response regulator GlrR